MTTITQKTDAELASAVAQELMWDPKVDNGGIAVKVQRGIVKLIGTTPTYASKAAAVDAAHRVAGVLDVADVIEVHLSDVTKDTDLAEAVRNALEWNSFVPHECIRSTVTAGWITLSGDVEFLYEKEEAVRAVKSLAGVRGVTNSIVVKPRAIAQEVIEKSVREALVRRAERGADNVRVSVTGTTVRLAGTVDSWAERQAIAQTARLAPGVTTVRDELEINPFT